LSYTLGVESHSEYCWHMHRFWEIDVLMMFYPCLIGLCFRGVEKAVQDQQFELFTVA